MAGTHAPSIITARSALQRRRRENALAGIREPEELAKLPGAERDGYLRF